MRASELSGGSRGRDCRCLRCGLGTLRLCVRTPKRESGRDKHKQQQKTGTTTGARERERERERERGRGARDCKS